MRLTYFGHATFRLEGDGFCLVFDPWLKGNPHGSIDPAAVPCTHVLCSHAHDDHIADALNLARAHQATVVAPYELASHFATQGATTLDLLPGGGVDLAFGRTK
jgi:L-ascorbate metabolism protein UlaG (beta-lactamase superfamily)